ncbi:MAG TPA: HTH domain-containing protein [Thermoanaerobaculia bacterium]|jgi:hypothetical protein
MPNGIWQAEEEKWERRRQRAERALAHIRELRKLEAEEGAEEGTGGAAHPAGQTVVPAGQVIEPAGRMVGPAGQPAEAPPLPAAPLPPKEAVGHYLSEILKKKTAREQIPGLLRERGPLTVKAMAESLDRSQQAIANALVELKQTGVVTEEPSTVPGFRFQYRLSTVEERQTTDAVSRGEKMS